MKIKSVFPAVFLFFLVPFLIAAEDSLPPLPKGPLLLTSVTPDQLSADYWIQRLPDPNKILKTPEEMKAFNEDIHAMIKDCVDVFKMETTKSGKPIRELLEFQYNTLSKRALYDVKNQRMPVSFFQEEVRPLVEWEKIPDRVKLRWGAATSATSVRALPTEVRMLEKPDDIEFDQLQFTQIKLWTPVAILHESTDGEWYFVQAPYARGWVKAQSIALFSSRDDLKKYVKSPKFLSVTGESIRLFSEPSLQLIHQKPSMGTLIPLSQKKSGVYEVFIPERGLQGKVIIKKGYIDGQADVYPGFLPFTQANIIRQAFKLLGARYGWGGTYNGRDCSGFTHDVFLSLGLEMPRGSKDQAFVGTQLGHFEYKENAAEKKEVLEEAVPGITLLRMPSHQMLYLGEVNGKFYAIHSTWAERISMTSDDKNRINQVVVSDLSLNGNSYLGGLFDRIISISEIS